MRPPQLDDPDWLARAYADRGDMAIALELGCDRKTVRLARQRLGIRSAPPGPRRGSLTAHVGAPARDDTDTLGLVAERFQLDQTDPLIVPDDRLLATRIRVVSAAHGDDREYDRALISLAAAALLVHEHRQNRAA